MLIHYVEAIQMALWTLQGWATSSVGIAVLTFLGALALVGAAMVLRRDEAWGRIELWQRGARWSLGWIGVLVVQRALEPGLDRRFSCGDAGLVWVGRGL